MFWCMQRNEPFRFWSMPNGIDLCSLRLVLSVSLFLQRFLAPQRNFHLRTAISQLNDLLYSRMLSKGHSSDNPDSVYQGDSQGRPTAHMVHFPSSHLFSCLLSLWSVVRFQSCFNEETEFFENCRQTSSIAEFNPKDVMHPSHMIMLVKVAQSLPSAAAYSLHLPLQHCGDKVLRILQVLSFFLPPSLHVIHYLWLYCVCRLNRRVVILSICGAVFYRVK